MERGNLTSTQLIISAPYLIWRKPLQRGKRNVACSIALPPRLVNLMTRICYQIIVKTPGDCDFCVPKFQNLQASTKKTCYDTIEAKYNKGVKNCKFFR